MHKVQTQYGLQHVIFFMKRKLTGAKEFNKDLRYPNRPFLVHHPGDCVVR
jgi:hypothetical protein